MKLKLNSKQIILGVICLCFVVLSTTFYLGKENNRKSKMDFDNYTYAIELINPNQAEMAIGILKQLDEKYPDNIFIKGKLGLASTYAGDPNSGSSYFQECLRLNPSMQLDVLFMLQYGEILNYNAEYEKAMVVLEKSLQLPSVGSNKVQIENLLSTINEKIKYTAKVTNETK